MKRALAVVLLVAGCASPPDVCAGVSGTCIALEVRAASGEHLAFDRLHLRAVGFQLDGDSAAPGGGSARLPVIFAVDPPADFHAQFGLYADVIAGDATLASGYVSDTVRLSGDHLFERITVVGASGGGDLGTQPDMAIPSPDLSTGCACGANQCCDQGKCVQVGATCSNGFHCGPNGSCSPAMSCNATMPCADPNACCVSGACIAPNAPCPTGGMCVNGLCSNGSCGAPAQRCCAAICQAGLHCCPNGTGDICNVAPCADMAVPADMSGTGGDGGVSPGGFAGPSSLNIGTAGVTAIATGDFDHDGRLDLAVGLPNMVNVFLGAPASGATPMFTAGPSSSALPAGVTALTPSSLVVADVNRDGKLDLLAVDKSGPNRTAVLMGDGKGGFMATNAILGISFVANSVAAGDFNGDGIPDALLAYANRPQIELGRGDGTFQPVSSVPTGNTSTSVATGDFNRDGKLDAVGADTSGYELWLGNGAGDLSAAPINITAATAAPALAVGDLNRDGLPDVVLMGSDGYVHVYLDQNGTSFAPAGSFAAGGNALAVGDFNGDGRADVATTNGTNVVIGLGDGTGKFAAATLTLTPGSAPIGLAPGDFDSDGRLDLATGNTSGPAVSVFANTTARISSFALTPTMGPKVSAGAAGEAIAAGDVDGNGTPDLVTAGSGSGNAWILANDGSANFTMMPVAAGTSSSGIALTDANHDGKLDMLVSDYSSAKLEVLTLVAGAWTGSSYPAGLAPVEVVVTDWNRDGWPDVFLAQSSGSSLYLQLNDRGGAYAATALTFAAGNTPNRTAVGDFDEDGKPDVVVVNSGDKTATRFLGDGASGFKASAQVALAAAYPPFDVAVGDVNHDGHQDLVFATFNMNAVLWVPGHGDGTFGTPSLKGFAAAPESIALGDLDGDGWLDAVVGTLAGLEVVALSPTPLVTFPAAPYGSGAMASVVAVDANRDGKTDVAALDTGGQVWLFLNTSM